MLRKISFLLCLLVAGLSHSASAQSPDISGAWRGVIEVPGMTLDVIVDFKKDGAKWTGDIDIPIQKIKDMALAEVILEGRNLKFKLPEVPGNASFSGKVAEGDEKIIGDFSQGGQPFPMKLVKESAADKAILAARTAKAITDFTALCDSLRKRSHIVGMSVALVKDDKVLISNGFGERELGKGNAVDDKTLFAIGSSSKAFTAASLAILADDGKLDWEKPVRDYLPDFAMHDRFATEEMTATDLMCHRSGLPRHDLVWYASSATREELYHRLQYLEPNASFRSTWQYQNLMVMTAGYLAGKINGTTWEALVQERIFKPLGMSASGFQVADMAKSPNAAKGYTWDDEKKVSTYLPYRNIDIIGPAGSINSNAQDMAAWLRLQLGEGKYNDQQIISATQVKNMHLPHMALGKPSQASELTAPSYGLGWFVYSYKGHRVVEHGGNIDGFSAGVFLMPDDGLGIVVLTNEDGSNFATPLCYQAADMFLGLPPTDWYARTYGDDQAKEKAEKVEEPGKPKPVKGTQPSHDLADYAGEYFNPGYGTLTVSHDSKALQAVFNGLHFQVTHFHYDVFNAHLDQPASDMLMAFQTGKEGDVYRVDLPMETSVADIEFIKMPPARLSDPVFLKELVGKYEFADGKLTIEIALVGGTKLQANVSGQGAQRMEPWRNTQFKLKDLNGYSLQFVADKKGVFETIVLRQPGIEMEGKRKL
jgi:CubicO group peptidase (beta-lactamase class C family)